MAKREQWLNNSFKVKSATTIRTKNITFAKQNNTWNNSKVNSKRGM